MTARAHRPGQASDDTGAADPTEGFAAGGDLDGIAGTSPQTDLANVEPATAGATAPETADDHSDHVHTAGDEETPHLAALGNANADVNVTAVRNAQGHYTWTARDAETGAELARSPHPHTHPTLIHNLQKLFSSDSVIALRRTGDDKARRLA
jgi:hypothetical protein